MPTKPANTAQKEWMSTITEWAYDNIELLYGDEYSYFESPFQRHHVMGRSAKQNKVAIGHWFIIPVPFELHDVSSSHDDSVTHSKKSFVKRFGTQRSLFIKMYNSMYDQKYDLSIIPHEVVMAIKDTSA